MNNSVNKKYNEIIEYYPRFYCPEEFLTNFSKRIKVSDQCDQICIRTLAGRVVSTGITKEFIDNYVNGRVTQEDALVLRNFLESITDCSLHEVSEEVLKAVCNFLLKSNNLEALTILLSSNGALLIKILGLVNSDGILTILTNVPKLLKLDPKLLDTILGLSNPLQILVALANRPNLLQPDCSQFLGKIVAWTDFKRIFNILDGCPKLLEFAYSKRLDKVLSLPDPFSTLVTLANCTKRNSANFGLSLDSVQILCPKLLESAYFGILNKGFNSSDPFSAFSALGRYPQVLEPDYSRSLEKIIERDDFSGILDIFGNYPKLLDPAFSNLLDKILFLPNFSVTLGALAGSPKLLEPAYSSFLARVLKSSDPDVILLSLTNKYSRLIEDPLVLEKLDCTNFLDAFAHLYFEKFVIFNPKGYSRHPDEPEVHFNKDMFFKSANIKKWNILIQREGEITDEDSEIVKVSLLGVFDAVFKEMEVKKELLLHSWGQCMSSSDAETEAGKQQMKKRMTAVVDILSQYLVEFKNLHTPDPRKKSLKIMIQSALDKMAAGGGACPNRAVVYLSEAETHLKLFEHPECAADVFLHMFKHEAIIIRLIDRSQNEDIQSLLRHTLELNDVLGLGLSGAMLHKIRTEFFQLDQTLLNLSPAFTEQGLIDFTAGLNEFRLMYENEKKGILAAKTDEYDNAYLEYMDVQDDPEQKDLAIKAFNESQKILDELKEIENSFYQNKARQLFLDAGILFESR